MALLPTQAATRQRLFAGSKPNYKDFSSPPNGDYVRYVEGLMAWAEEEQERLRLQALGAKSREMPDAAWGRQMVVPAAQSGPLATGRATPVWEQWMQQAQTQVQQWQQQAREVEAGEGVPKAPTLKPEAHNSRPVAVKSSGVFLWLFALFVVVLIIADLFEF